MKSSRPLFDLAGCLELDRTVRALKKCLVMVSNSNEQKSSFLVSGENSLLNLTRSDLMDTMGSTLGTRNITIDSNPNPPYKGPPTELIGDIHWPVTGPPTIRTPDSPNTPIIIIGYKPPTGSPSSPIYQPPIIVYGPGSPAGWIPIGHTSYSVGGGFSSSFGPTLHGDLNSLSAVASGGNLIVTYESDMNFAGYITLDAVVTRTSGSTIEHPSYTNSVHQYPDFSTGTWSFVNSPNQILEITIVPNATWAALGLDGKVVVKG